MPKSPSSHSKATSPPPAAKKSPREQALAWWHKRVERGTYLVPSPETPPTHLAKILLKGGYAFEVAGRRAWLLRTPHGPDDRAVFLLNYWRVVSLVLKRYRPAAVTGLDAVRLHLDEATIPTTLRARHGANLSRYRLSLFDDYILNLVPDTVDPEHVASMTVQHADVPVESPAIALLNLTLEDMRDHMDVIRPWVRQLYLAPRELRSAYHSDPKPVRLQRAADLANTLGNTRLSETLSTVLLDEYPHQISRSATKLGTTIAIPQIVSSRSASIPPYPWLERQATTFSSFAQTIHAEFGDREAALPRLTADLLLGNAHRAKSYDIYHSTTMEGYQITPEGVEAALHHPPPRSSTSTTPQSQEEFRARMAVLGYAAAFESILTRATHALKAGIQPPITETDILDLYVDLFSPSVDAGIVATTDLRGWRTRGVSLVGWRHIPPNPTKLPGLMQQYTELVNAFTDRPLTRAILSHLQFVTIHPFVDGNGRLGRLLMNLVLLSAGLPWITIRSDERVPYFAALERAQVESDIRPFAALVTHYVEQAIHNFPQKQRTRR